MPGRWNPASMHWGIFARCFREPAAPLASFTVKVAKLLSFWA